MKKLLFLLFVTYSAYSQDMYMLYKHPTTDGSLHVPATGTTNNGKFLKAGATAGSFAWAIPGIVDISGLQTALDLKAPLANPTFTGTVVLPSTTSIGTVSNTELSYVDGVTSSIQTQLGTKAPLASPTFTGTVVVPDGSFAPAKLTAGTNNQVLMNVSGTNQWGTFNYSTMGTGVLGVGFGGIGRTSVSAGAIPLGTSSASLSELLPVATGNVLLSKGTGVAPGYGKVTDGVVDYIWADRIGPGSGFNVVSNAEYATLDQIDQTKTIQSQLYQRVRKDSLALSFSSGILGVSSSSSPSAINLNSWADGRYIGLSSPLYAKTGYVNYMRGLNNFYSGINISDSTSTSYNQRYKIQTNNIGGYGVFQITSSTNGGLYSSGIFNIKGSNVGIGDANPAVRLAVAGDISLTGTFNTPLLNKYITSNSGQFSSISTIPTSDITGLPDSLSAKLNKTGGNITGYITTNTVDNRVLTGAIATDSRGIDVNHNFTGSTANNGQMEILSTYGMQIVNNFSGTVGESLDRVKVFGINVVAAGDMGVTGGVQRHEGILSSAYGTAEENYAFRSNYVANATKNYGMYISSPDPGPNNYAINSTTTAKSYYAGPIGIKTTTPAYDLDVAGSVRASDSLNTNKVNTAFLNLNSSATNYGIINTTNASGGRIDFKQSGVSYGMLGNGNWIFSGGNNSDMILGSYTGKVHLGTNGALKLTVTNAGNVGIATTAPSFGFDSQASTNRISGTIRTNNAAYLNKYLKTDINGDWQPISAIPASDITQTAYNVLFANGSGVGSGNNGFNYEPGNGRLGIGLAYTAVRAKLDVFNVNGGAALRVGINDTDSTYLNGNFIVRNTSTLNKNFIVTNAGKVGIGTINPASLLTVSGATGTAVMTLQRPSFVASSNLGSLGFANGASNYLGAITYSHASTDSTAAGAMSFRLGNANASSYALTERMQINSAGVGIGTAATSNFQVLTGAAETNANYALIQTSATDYRGGLLISNAVGTTVGYTSFKVSGASNTNSSSAIKMGFVANSFTGSWLNSGAAITIAYSPAVLSLYGDNGGSVTIGTYTATEKLSVNGNIYSTGKRVSDATYTAGGTTGNQTINKPSGSVNFAAGATSLTVTNSFATANSIITAVVMVNDTTAYVKNVVPGSGTFTINLGAAATAETKVGFIVSN